MTSNTTAPPQATPSCEAVEAFFALFGKGLNAAMQRRCLRAAEYFGRAAAEVSALWGDKGELIVVHALLQQNSMLVEHAQTLTAVGDAAPLWLEAYRNVAEIRHILNARLSANTCLVGLFETPRQSHSNGVTSTSDGSTARPPLDLL